MSDVTPRHATPRHPRITGDPDHPADVMRSGREPVAEDQDIMAGGREPAGESPDVMARGREPAGEDPDVMDREGE